MEADEYVNVADYGAHFRIRILISHPSADLQGLTEALGMNPKLVHHAGKPRMSPTGRPLPGCYDQSKWSWWADVKNSRRFRSSVFAAVEHLCAGSEALASLHSSGGTTTLMLDLDGTISVGDVVDPSVLKKMGDLGVRFGVEVFPGGV